MSERKTVKYEFKLVKIPVTSNLQFPIPSAAGGHVPYSSDFVGFTQVEFATSQPVVVEVEDTGDSLANLTEVLFQLAQAISEANRRWAEALYRAQRQKAKEMVEEVDI